MQPKQWGMYSLGGYVFDVRYAACFEYKKALQEFLRLKEEKEKIMKSKELFRTQRLYDAAVKHEHKIEKLEPSRILIAMQDEIGELAHALKKEWCWWRKSQEMTDWDHVLEELVDVLHFALSYTNHRGKEYELDAIEKMEFISEDNKYERDAERAIGATFELQKTARFYPDQLVPDVFEIGQMLGFSGKEIEDAYYVKSRENMRRLQTGY